MDQLEQRLRRRDRCIELAEAAPSETIRAWLLQAARLYETDTDPIERTMHCFAGSKQLIAKVEALPRPREPNLHASLLSDQDFPLARPYRAIAVPIPDTSSAIRHP
jgi:hypothetical protein